MITIKHLQKQLLIGMMLITVPSYKLVFGAVVVPIQNNQSIVNHIDRIYHVVRGSTRGVRAGVSRRNGLCDIIAK